MYVIDDSGTHASNYASHAPVLFLLCFRTWHLAPAKVPDRSSGRPSNDKTLPHAYQLHGRKEDSSCAQALHQITVNPPQNADSE
jgi:hypothetical protein